MFAEICAPKERPSVGQGKAVQWPASAASYQLHGMHIHLVYIRPLFPVYFDAYKVPVHQCRYLFIFK